MNEQRLQEIKERAEKAIPGPWYTNNKYIRLGKSISGYDAEFIAHAREDVSALIVEVERLRKALEFYADKENWERHLQCEIDVRQGQTLPIWDPSAIEFDEGETARRALEGH